MDFIEVYDNALSDELCDKLIQAFEEKSSFARYTDNEIRKDYAIQLDNFESLWPLRDKVAFALRDCWEQYGNKYGTYNEFNDIVSPTFKMQKSVTDGGFTFWHSEQGSDPKMISRFAVWMFYLNDDFEGGNTAFKFQDKSIRPKKGSCVIWPAAFTHLHRAEPDLVGTKYILTGWFRYIIPSLGGK